MQVGGQRHVPAALPPGKTRYPLYRRLGKLQGRSWTGAENLAPTGIRSPDRPAHSESLYGLSYPLFELYTTELKRCTHTKIQILHARYSMRTHTAKRPFVWLELPSCSVLLNYKSYYTRLYLFPLFLKLPPRTAGSKHSQQTTPPLYIPAFTEPTISHAL